MKRHNPSMQLHNLATEVLKSAGVRTADRQHQPSTKLVREVAAIATINGLPKSVLAQMQQRADGTVHMHLYVDEMWIASMPVRNYGATAEQVVQIATAMLQFQLLSPTT